MKIVIEDYNGNDLCEMNINLRKSILSVSQCDIEDLIGCDIADIDTDDNGREYLIIKLNEEEWKHKRYKAT